MTDPGIATVGKRLALAGALLLLAGTPGRTEPAKPTKAESARAAQALAAKIDEHMAKHWKDNQVQPAPAADDAEFLRRAYLDLIGRIPSAGEARRFLDDQAPAKRQRLIDDLLNSPRYTTHWVNYWEAMFLPERKNLDEGKVNAFFGGGRAFQAWLRQQLDENAGYDKMARELLMAPIDPLIKAGNDVFLTRPSIPYTFVEPGPQAFYAAKEAKPENLAAGTARYFLGIRLECAQCHDHPFAKWKREQFWNQAAFFAGLEAPGKGVRPFRDNPSVKTIAISGGDKVVPARFLDGSEPKWQDKVGGRQTLADWVTSPKNPYFARAISNRLWAYFVGTGLIEPVDEMVGSEAQDNDPGGVLDELARALVEHDFDLKFLMRAITATKVYQLTSARTHPSQDDPRLFARMTIRGLTAEQLFDSLAEAIGYRLPQQKPVYPNSIGPPEPRERFLATFANRSEKPVETQTSIPQALALMNGGFVADATTLRRSRALAALLDLPLVDTAGRVEALYLATLSRQPRPNELKRMVQFIEQASAEREAFADVFWVLLNSAEFKLNH
jgi:Protein of unknown function (DUF1549)/Protein of unknown function (DUF1553)